MKRLLGLALLTLLVPAAPASAKHLVLVRLGSFDRPTHAASPPGDRSRLFVVEQAGRIMVIDRGRKLGTPFLDIRGRVRYDGEQGMLSMAFDPNYKANGRFYVDYVDHGGNTNVVAFRRSSRNGNRADAASGRRVLFVRNPDGEHYGGLLLFGPDRRLYVGIGDGGGVGDPHGAHGNAQNKNVLLGKILRIEPRPGTRRGYSVPSDNPFAGATPGRGEIWAYGLRNPWRFSFDRVTRAMTIGDVGDARREEIDHASFAASRGANWGWRVFEGPLRRTHEAAPGARRPILSYGHGATSCAVVGGFVVRDRALGGLYGRYVYGDHCDYRLRVATLRNGHATGRRALAPHIEGLASLSEGAGGRLFAISSNGAVSRLALR